MDFISDSYEITIIDVDGNHLTLCCQQRIGEDERSMQYHYTSFSYTLDGLHSGDISFLEWVDCILKWTSNHKPLTTVPKL